MTSPATKVCDRCDGEGTVPRPEKEIRKLDNGTLDPTDLRRIETCDRCGGSGKIPENYAGLKDKAAGYIADKI